VFVCEPTILHADVDAFYASVEQRDDPRLRGRPVIVGGGVVLAASYEARAHGVRSAMGGAQARRLCPQAVVVGPRWAAYTAASRAVFEVFHRFSPVVEGLSSEEAFLDVRGLRRISGAPEEIAARLRREVRERVGLAISVGVARTKALAKVASGAAKPDGLLVVPVGREREFLHALRVERLWGVGPATARRLHARGITTVGEIAALERAAVVEILGPAAGRRLHALAHNRDPRPVRRGRRRRSFGAQSACARRARSPADADAVLAGLVDRVTRRMRSAGRIGRTVMLRLRFADFSRATRSATLARATAETQPILDAARALLAAAMPAIERRGLTLVGVTVANVERDGGGVQLALPLGGRSSAALDVALDEIRERFGPDALRRAVLLSRRAGSWQDSPR
jgi:nucleotidyltransferase/DNA polymerase involved in DNA repair